MTRRNPIARALRSPHLRQQIVPNKKRADKESLRGDDSETMLHETGNKELSDHERELRSLRILYPE